MLHSWPSAPPLCCHRVVDSPIAPLFLRPHAGQPRYLRGAGPLQHRHQGRLALRGLRPVLHPGVAHLPVLQVPRLRTVPAGLTASRGDALCGDTRDPRRDQRRAGSRGAIRRQHRLCRNRATSTGAASGSVSYTHLTLPTICSV
eukprot:5534115-Prymnesium_polylepis.1